jgi:hypothetical protein
MNGGRWGGGRGREGEGEILYYIFIPIRRIFTITLISPIVFSPKPNHWGALGYIWKVFVEKENSIIWTFWD